MGTQEGEQCGELTEAPKAVIARWAPKACRQRFCVTHTLPLRLRTEAPKAVIARWAPKARRQRFCETHDRCVYSMRPTGLPFAKSGGVQHSRAHNGVYACCCAAAALRHAGTIT